MKNIVALIDFTPTSSVVVDFAKNIALSKNAKVILLTILESNDPVALQTCKSKMEVFVNTLNEAGVSNTSEIYFGNFFSTVSSAVLKVHASLVIIGTHGKKGLKQNLFGSNILKLVKILPVASLVVQENSVWPVGGFKHVYFSIATHSRFDMKAEQTKSVIADDAHVTLYAIDRAGDPEEQLRKNINLCEKKFKKLGINYEIVEEDTTIYSVGFSRQSLEYVKNSPTDLISIMAQVSQTNSYFGNADKENVILNEMAIPVLCCNDDEPNA